MSSVSMKNTVFQPWFRSWSGRAPSERARRLLVELALQGRVYELGGFGKGRLCVDQTATNRHRVAILSSRFEGNLSRMADVFAELACAIRRAHSVGRVTIACDDHIARLVDRCANGKSITVAPIRHTRTEPSFWRRLESTESGQIIVSPPLNSEAGKLRLTVDVAMAWAEAIHLLCIRSGSTVVPRLLDLLAHDTNPREKQVFAYQPFVPKCLLDDLMNGGVNIVQTGRLPLPPPRPIEKYSWPSAIDTARRIAPLTRGRLGLVHCVRGTAGLRMGELSAGQLDMLLSGRPLAGQSPLDALERIVRSRRLDASSLAIRNQALVTCFTAKPLCRLRELHRYRQSRRRWEFLPIGIWFEQRRLAELGAQPVVYGDETTWNSLPTHQRPWYQPLGSSSSADWQREDEWRVVGDLELKSISPDCAFLFVPTVDEARRLQTHSRWPVLALNVDTSTKR